MITQIGTLYDVVGRYTSLIWNEYLLYGKNSIVNLVGGSCRNGGENSVVSNGVGYTRAIVVCGQGF